MKCHSYYLFVNISAQVDVAQDTQQEMLLARMVVIHRQLNVMNNQNQSNTSNVRVGVLVGGKLENGKM